MQCSNGLQWAQMGSNGLQWVPMGSNWLQLPPMGSNGLYWTQLGSTGLHSSPLDYTWLHWAPLESTGIYSGPLCCVHFSGHRKLQHYPTTHFSKVNPLATAPSLSHYTTHHLLKRADGVLGCSGLFWMQK